MSGNAIRASLNNAVERFPVAALMALASFVVGLAVIHGGLKLNDIDALTMTLSTSLFWSVCMTLYGEAHGMERTQSQAGAVCGIVPLALLYFLADSAFVYYCSLLTGAILGMGIAPYLKNPRVDQGVFWQFNHRLWRRIAFTCLVAFLLWAGISIIFASAQYLFGFKFTKIYADAWAFSALLFAPLFAMGGLPTQFDAKPEDFTKTINILYGYMLLPMLMVYAVLLHLYALKIGMAGELPKGKVAYLVCGFGGVGAAAYLSTLTVVETNRIVVFFHRNFFWWLVVPLALMAVGLYERISSYGITENRFCILLGWCWLVGAVVLRFRKQMAWMPHYLYGTAVCLILLSGFIATPISSWNQLNRLEAILVKNELLKDGEIVKATTPVSFEDRAEISAQLEYLVQTGKVGTLNQWFSGDAAAKAAMAENKKRWRTSAKPLMEAMGLEYLPRYSRRNVEREGGEEKKPQQQTYTMRQESQAGEWPIMVSGYDYYLSSFPLNAGRERVRKLKLLSGEVTLVSEFDNQTHKLTIWLEEEGKENGAVFDFSPNLAEMEKAIQSNANQFTISIKKDSPWLMHAKGKSLDAQLQLRELKVSVETEKADAKPELSKYQSSAQLLFSIKSVKPKAIQPKE